MQQNNKKLIPIIAAATILLIPMSIIARLNMIYQNTCFPQISLNGENYSGNSKEEAQKALEDKITATYPQGMEFSYENQTFIIPLSELGIQIDTEKSTEEVFSYGHRDNILTSLIEQAKLLKNDIDFQNELNYSDFLVEDNRREELSKIEKPVQNFSYEFDGKDFQAIQPREGLVINEDKLKADIEKNLLTLKNDPITIELVIEEPVITKDTEKDVVKKAKNLIERQIALEYDSSSWEVTKEDFGKWVDFVPQENGSKYKLRLTPNKRQIEDYLISLVPQVNSEPVNAQLEFNENRVEVFALSQEGVRLNTEKSAEKIGEAIFKEENYTKIETMKDSSPEDSSGISKEANRINQNKIIIELITEKVQPKLTTENINNMGITSLLATGESNFYGSTNSRKHNVAVGASKFNGVLIGPGEEFSFNDILGNVGAQEGYLPELVIKQGATVPEYGGGLCQVSTTAFRGAVASGLEITERKNHAYAVSYYSPQGTDATIYPPHPDLAFINNTPAYILIQTRISGNNLYFDFYGTDDGRKVEMEGPVVYERGAGGAMKTVWTQRVYDKNGNLFLEEPFYSNYKSAALYPRNNPLQ
ncbi:MAG: VanW family protein [Candidatus Pacebacteria bacterium]|nr:VanW family protein [Candidatus Paceibacterota bacterium]